jgi:hypothetical protein
MRIPEAEPTRLLPLSRSDVQRTAGLCSSPVHVSLVALTALRQVDSTGWTCRQRRGAFGRWVGPGRKLGSSTPTTRLESRGQSVPYSLARRGPCEGTSIRPTGLLLNCNRRQSPPRTVGGWPPRRRSAQHRQTAVREPQSAAQPFCRSPDRQRSNTPSKEPEMWTGPLRRTVLQPFRTFHTHAVEPLEGLASAADLRSPGLTR